MTDLTMSIISLTLPPSFENGFSLLLASDFDQTLSFNDSGYVLWDRLMFYEMSIFERLRKWHEDKSNRPWFGLERFVLVRPLKSVTRCSAGHSGRGDLLSMIEDAVSTTPIVFILIILLFGFDSTGQVKTQLALKIAQEISNFLKSRSSKD
jgi:hypothetical protein